MFGELSPQAVSWITVIALMSLAVWLSVREFWIKRRKRLSRWQVLDVIGDFASEHHLPEKIPVPLDQVKRVQEGDFALEDAVAWIREYNQAFPKHPALGEYEQVLRKYELYREMSDKMGRGRWKDVDALGQRLAELDPLDPSAMVARGRAMRELGNFVGAIRQYQKALDLTPFHSRAFPEYASTCRAIGQPGRFRPALERAREVLGDTHPLTIEGRIQLGELVRVYADPVDPATLAHIPREQYVQNVQSRLEQMTLDNAGCLEFGENMLADDMPELAEMLAQRCEREFGRCHEAVLLEGMIEQYRINLEAAETLLREALGIEDSAKARLQLGKVLLQRAAAQERPDAALLSQAHEQLRLAVDRDPNLVEAIMLLVEGAWDDGLQRVSEDLTTLAKAYPQAWGPWRVLGDAYASEDRYRKAVETYREGLLIADTDALLLPCLDAMEAGKMHGEMLEVVRGIRRKPHRDPQLRWRCAQILFEHQKLKESRRVLQNLVDDERVPPQLRQRANDVLDHMDNVERRRQTPRPDRKRGADQG